MDDLWTEHFPEDRLQELYALYVQEWWTSSRQFDDFVKMIRNSDIVLGRYSEDGKIVGFARVLTDFTFKAMVFDVIVASEARGQGLGQQIVQKLFDHPSLSGVQSFELYCPERLIPFYEKLGFKTGQSKLLFRRA